MTVKLGPSEVPTGGERARGHRGHAARQDGRDGLQHAALGFLRVVGWRRPTASTTPSPGASTSRARPPPSMTAWVEADIETDYDFLYVETSTDGHDAGPRSAPRSRVRHSPGRRRPGTCPRWQARRARSASATPPTAASTTGPFVDDIAISASGAPVFTDDVESGDNGWICDGFTRMGGSTLDPGQPSSTWPRTASTRATTRPCRPGRTTSGSPTPARTGWSASPTRTACPASTTVDGAYGDNNPSPATCHGQVLPVDARPEPALFYDGSKLDSTSAVRRHVRTGGPPTR